MNLLTVVAVVTALNLLIALVDLFVDLRFARPQRRRSQELEHAHVAWSSAEQKFAGTPKAGRDKGRYALQYMLAQGIPPARADALLHKVHRDMKALEGPKVKTLPRAAPADAPKAEPKA